MLKLNETVSCTYLDGLDQKNNNSKCWITILSVGSNGDFVYEKFSIKFMGISVGRSTYEKV